MGGSRKRRMVAMKSLAQRTNKLFAKLSFWQSVLLLLLVAIIASELFSATLAFLIEGELRTYIVFITFVVTFAVSLPIVAISIATIKNLDKSRSSLKEANQTLQAVISASPLPILFLDAEGKVSMWNRAAERTFGWTEEEVLGRPLPIVPEDKRDESEALHHRALRCEDLSGVEVIRRRKDGSSLDVSIWTAPLRDAKGVIVGFMKVIADISERKQAEFELREAKERAEYASRAKSEFLANMSHEVRTPLTAIIGFSEIIKDGLLGPVAAPKYVEYASDIHYSGNHLLDIINDILDVSKIEAGNYELREATVALPSTIDFAVRMCAERARRSDIRLDTEIDDGIPALFGDERAVRQMLINLLSNAVKFTPEGGAITVHAAGQQGAGIMLSVSDTGIGIGADDLPKIIEPFAQVESAYTRKHAGTGLGLPLVKLMIELHGGTLEIDSEPGVGTTVRLRFPPERTVHWEEAVAPTMGAA